VLELLKLSSNVNECKPLNHGGTGLTPVMYYYTCDSVNGGAPCKLYRPLEVKML
jgi:hypothetical protein